MATKALTDEEYAQIRDIGLTDEAWQSLEPKPDLPQWTASFIR